MPVRVTAVGLTVRVAAGAVTVKVTGIATGGGTRRVDGNHRVIVPAVNEPVAAVAMIDLLPVPEGEEILNQAALSLTVHAPLELMAMVWAAGWLLPALRCRSRWWGTPSRRRRRR